MESGFVHRFLEPLRFNLLLFEREQEVIQITYEK